MRRFKPRTNLSLYLFIFAFLPPWPGRYAAALEVPTETAQESNDEDQSQSVRSQDPRWDRWWLFEDRGYYDPLIAGVRDAHISVFGGWASRMNFMVKDTDPRLVWDIDLGAELPLFGWESQKTVDAPMRMPSGATGIGLWLFIDFHMIEDFVDDSNPIINTDYRFGLSAKIQRGLRNHRHRWISLRILLGHESTHLGDEFSIAGQREFPATFERINVSWEFVDLGLLYENRKARRPWSIRAGATATALPFGTSYYSVGARSITESPLGPVVESKNWIDPYAGFQVEFSSSWEDWTPYLSSELRWRSVYDYHRAGPDVAEKRQLSINLISGLKRKDPPQRLGALTPFIRFYHGVNPHGQFRNQKGFTQYGIGLRLMR